MSADIGICWSARDNKIIIGIKKRFLAHGYYNLLTRTINGFA